MVSKSIKLLRYELKRIVATRLYLILTGVMLAYIGFVLETQTMFGESGTAPYSQWSYLAYLSSVIPLISMVLFTQLAKLQGSEERQVQALTLSSPTSMQSQQAVKETAIGAAYLIQVVLAVLAAYVFFGMKFKILAPLNLLGCTAILAIPQLFLCIGVGLWVSKIHPYATYVLAALLFFCYTTQVMMPMGVDLLGNSILQIARATYPVQGEIAFAWPISYMISRGITFVIGVVLTVVACMQKRKVA
ncbi:MAG: hypothetical protein ACOX3W_07925 [Christensenellaceae bacterium]|jgi:hypothetical protein